MGNVHKSRAATPDRTGLVTGVAPRRSAHVEARFEGPPSCRALSGNPVFWNSGYLGHGGMLPVVSRVSASPTVPRQLTWIEVGLGGGHRPPGWCDPGMSPYGCCGVSALTVRRERRGCPACTQRRCLHEGHEAVLTTWSVVPAAPGFFLLAKEREERRASAFSG